MSYYEQGNKRRLLLGQENNTLVSIIAVNLIIFCILAFLKAIYYVNNGVETGLPLYNRHILQWLSLPADTGTLLVRPWTLFTHMFVHDSVWHLIGNMLWLWFFGYIFQDLTGTRKIFPVYIFGSLAGALAFILSYNFLPALKPELAYQSAVGASAGIMAIAIATTMIAPGYRLLPMINGGIPIWVLTLIYVVIDLAMIPYGNTGGQRVRLERGTEPLLRLVCQSF
jgi:membrane associated rhomboid family serine protease